MGNIVSEIGYAVLFIIGVALDLFVFINSLEYVKKGKLGLVIFILGMLTLCCLIGSSIYLYFSTTAISTKLRNAALIAFIPGITFSFTNLIISKVGTFPE